jgi:peptide/nickel transport system substrate-binding protein
VKWHDGKDFSADDVVFTIQTIENSDTRSDLYNVWQGVKVEKLANDKVRFTLSDSYPDFPRVASQPIIAMHIFENIQPKNIKIAEDNTNPIGTGPFKFVRFDQLGAQPETVLARNDNFSLGAPYLDNIRVVSYTAPTDLYDGLLRKQIDVSLSIDPSNYNSLVQLSGFATADRFLPEYEVAYLNLRNPILSNLDFRKALIETIDRTKIMPAVVGNRGTVQWGPLLAGSEGYSSKQKQTGYNLQSALDGFINLGWVKDKNGFLTKNGKSLSFNIVCPDTFRDTETANQIAGYFTKAGIKTQVKVVDPEQITASYIRPRNFDLLVISQNIGYSTDWYSLWDSSQINYPGLNLSGLSDKSLDKFVEQARRTRDASAVSERASQAASEIVAQAPAIYLFRDENVALFSQKLFGENTTQIVTPIDYLNTAYQWYSNTTLQ